MFTLAEWCTHDISQYVPNGYLEFNVKGKNGGEQFTIGARDSVEKRPSGKEITITQPISGGFYARVVSDNDENVTKRIIKDKEGNVTNIKSTYDTASAAAILAQASIIYRDYDAEFALTCLNAATRGWAFLEQNPNNIKSPTGPYTTDDDSSERLWAAASLYRATNNETYNNYFLANYAKYKSSYEDMYGDKCSISNAFFSYMMAQNPSSEVKEWFTKEFTIWLNNKIDRFNNSTWGNLVANGNYYWGINSQILGMCMDSLIGSRILGLTSDTVNKMILSSLNWILGANPMRKSFVSGYGEDSIQNVFSTIYRLDGKSGIPKGIIPGGANKYNNTGLSLFPAKCYIDSAGDWTTNEHSTYWNAILEFVVAFANSGISNQK